MAVVRFLLHRQQKHIVRVLKVCALLYKLTRRENDICLYGEVGTGGVAFLFIERGAEIINSEGYH